MSNPEPSRHGAGRDAAEKDRKHASSIPGDQDPDVGQGPADKKARDVQPGTAEPGKSWHSRSPDPDDKDDQLNQALKDSFPASDPPQAAQPGVTGWDLTDAEKKEQQNRSAT